MLGTLTMNHMTITKMYSLEHEDILDMEKSLDFISTLPNESALKRLLRIGRISYKMANNRKPM
jgi:magnesium-transporting ATPase (P-type)